MFYNSLIMYSFPREGTIKDEDVAGNNQYKLYTINTINYYKTN